MKDELARQVVSISDGHITSIEWGIVRAGLLKVITTDFQKFLGENALP